MSRENNACSAFHGERMSSAHSREFLGHRPGRSQTFTRHASQWIKSTAYTRCRYTKCKLIACHMHARYSQYGRQYRYNSEPITCQAKSDCSLLDPFKTLAAFLHHLFFPSFTRMVPSFIILHPCFFLFGLLADYAKWRSGFLSDVNIVIRKNE